jgi:hypothetical protein
MAVGHYTYNRSSENGQGLFQALTDLEEGRDGLTRIVGALVQMQDGGTLTSYAVTKFGFTDTTSANAALAELNSAKGALDGIAATLTQLFNKFRNGV